jgi:hypothetical protein
MNTLKQTADAILQKPVTISIDTPADNWKQRILVKLRLRKEKRVFEVRPLVLGSLIRISELLLSIDKQSITQEKLEDKQQFLSLNFELMRKHSRQMAEVVAIAVTNEKKEPDNTLTDFFLYHLTPGELLEVFMVIVQQMNVSGFINCIISIRGINVMEMNPENQGS